MGNVTLVGAPTAARPRATKSTPTTDGLIEPVVAIDAALSDSRENPHDGSGRRPPTRKPAPADAASAEPEGHIVDLIV